MKVILHCSDSPFGDALLINEWHVERGWNMIGYHFVVLNGVRRSKNIKNDLDDGKIEEGRPLSMQGAHCYGHNDSVGICLIGNSASFTVKQLTTLENELLPELREIYGTLEIFQHSDFDDKKPYCAGLPQNLLDKWNKLINL